MIASGGATLEDHWRSDSVTRRIRAGRWTHVVLNDQSVFGEGWWLEGKARVGSSGSELAEFGGRFAQVVREAGATPVFLAHWANADAPARDQQALDYLFAKVAGETGSAVALVGPAIKRMQAETSMITPYFTDNHHLSPAGAYMEALIIYSALTGHSPIGAAHRLVGPAVEFNRGIVLDSVVVLVDLSPRDAAAIQRIAASTYFQTRARIAAISAPQPLSAEFPNVPQHGDIVERRNLQCHWHGRSLVLPNPAGDSVDIEFSFRNGSEPSPSDSVHLRTGALQLAGPGTVSFDGPHIVVRASLMPQQTRTRMQPAPLALELRAVLRGGVMIGVATLQQRFAGSRSSFDAVGRFEASCAHAGWNDGRME